ncbi:MAG TPA: DUF3887 domain-containing protein [Mycobacteriales bacterium]|nr:DUF3887 domain-containing protein [Mycobacteriales bacterium]
MSDLEDRLRDQLHGRLDGVEPAAGLSMGVATRAARIRQRRTALVSGVVALTLVGGVSLAVVVPRWRADRTSIGVTGAPAEGAPGETVGERAVSYAGQFAAGDFESVRADMTPAARSALTAARLRGVWRRLFDAGARLEVGDPRESVTDNRPVGSAVVRSSTIRAVLRIVVDDDGRIRSVLLTADGDADFEADPGIRRTREIVAQLAAGDYQGMRRDFNATMRTGLSARRLQMAWEQMLAQYGAFDRVDGVISRLQGSTQVVDAVCEFAEGTLKVRVAYDSDQRVAGLFILVLDA